jgi:hypothetical protein
MGESPEPDRTQPWWQQIPTWLTAIAAFITAVGGAWVVFGVSSSQSSTSTTLGKDPGTVNISSILPKSSRERTFYDVAGVWRPVSPDSGSGGSGQWVVSPPARVESDGRWTTTLTVAKALSDKLIISAVVTSKSAPSSLEARLRESGPAAPGVDGATRPVPAPVGP